MQRVTVVSPQSTRKRQVHVYRKKRTRRLRRRTTSRRFSREARNATVVLRQWRRRWALPPLGRAQLLSLGLIGVVIALLAFVGMSSWFYLYDEAIQVEGCRYTPREDVLQAAQVEGWHIFFIDPREIAQRVEALPYVRRAHVRIGFPARMWITVEERTPVLRWERKGTLFWVDKEGHVMPAREGGPPLLVVDPEGAATVEDAEEGIRFDPYVLTALDEVHAILPEVSTIYYDTSTGLRFVLKDNAGDIQVYLGTLMGLEERLSRLPQVLKEMRARGTHFRLIDLSHPEEVVVLP